MDTNTISSMISNIGFPIIACYALYKMYSDSITELKNSVNALEKTVDANTETVRSLQKVVEKFLDSNRS